jgi:hypothetical protein
MRHAEEGNSVTCGNLQLGQIFHVRLGATTAVEELVDVEDAHVLAAYRIVGMIRDVTPG